MEPELPPAAAHLLDHGTLSGLTAAAVLVPVIRHPEGARMLLTVRARQLRNHAGQISFPGGRRDAEDADVDANALREAHEEVGLDPAHVTVVGYLDDYPTITGFRVTPVVGLIDARTPLAPDGVEVASFFEVPLAFLLDPANYQRHWFRRDGLDLPFYAVPYGERFIWGATAGMLYELAQRCAAVMD